MWKKIQVTVIALCTVMTLAACADRPEAAAPPEPAAVAPAASAAPQPEKTAAPDAAAADVAPSPAMTTGVEIDWDDIDSPLWEEDMRGPLEAALHAIVDKDGKALNEALSPDAAGIFEYMLENDYKFEKIDDVHAEAGRVLVPVESELSLNGETPREIEVTFYFEQDGAGAWRIVSID